MKIEKSKVMRAAWIIARNQHVSIGAGLAKAWTCARINQNRIHFAQTAAGITEECNSYAGWKAKGYEVKHGSKSLFGCNLIWGSKGDGEIYNVRFFGRSQVQEIG